MSHTFSRSKLPTKLKALFSKERELTEEEKQEKHILRSPTAGHANEFYWACREGELNKVKQILAITRFDELNRLEPNGSTALHAAVFFGHVDIVRLLLHERGVMRHRKNLHGLTAYEEAGNDEIRELFHRPNSNRFCDNSTNNNEIMFNCAAEQLTESDDDDDEPSAISMKDIDNGLTAKTSISSVQATKIMFSSPFLWSLAVRLGRKENDPENINLEKQGIIALKDLIDKHVTSNHPQYDKACELLSRYTKTKNLENLLRLYTLETPFYYCMQSKTDDENVMNLLYIRLKSLKPRAFHGRSYRGLTMPKTSITIYRRAARKKDRIIWLRTFCSTSVDEGVAQRFVPSCSDEKVKVLMIFEFPDPCDMAIQLYTLSPTLPCISEFEEEREVLILPGTLFSVVNITHDDRRGHWKIHLRNALAKIDLTSLWVAHRKN